MKYPTSPSMRSERRNSARIGTGICYDMQAAVLLSLQTHVGNPERGLTTKSDCTPQRTGGGRNSPPSATHARNEDGTRYLILLVFYGNKRECGAQELIRKSVYWGSDVVHVADAMRDLVEFVDLLKERCEYSFELGYVILQLRLCCRVYDCCIGVGRTGQIMDFEVIKY